MSEEKIKKAATPRGRKKKEVKEEHIASIGPDSSPELVHEELGRAADNISVKEAPKEEGDWGSFDDRGAPVKDEMIEEGKGEPIQATEADYQSVVSEITAHMIPSKDETPSLMGEDEQNEKPAGVLDGEFTIVGDGKEKPKGQLTLANNKAKLNTTQEGLDNMAALIRMDLKTKVIPKVKILPKAVIIEGDFDKCVDAFCDVIHGKVPVLKVHVGDDGGD